MMKKENFLSKIIALINATKKVVIMMTVAGMVFPAYANNQYLANNKTIGQLIVKLKPDANKDMANFQSAQLSTPQANNLLTRAQAVINRVADVRNSRTQRLFKSQSNSVSDIADSMRPEKSIDPDTVVLSLKRQIARADAEQLINDIEGDAAVAYAELDVRVQHFLVPNDPLYQEQWGLSNEIGGANLPAAWDQTVGSHDVVVAVIDTGYLPHADLKANLLHGYDFTPDVKPGQSYDGRDLGDPCEGSNSSWHGSHVMGIIGAISNNNLGISGIAWRSKLLPVRVLGKCGAYLSDIITGMRWAAGLPVDRAPSNPHPAKVMNLSLGAYGEKCSQAFASAIQDIKDNGASIVVAAGNEKDSVASTTPANCKGVIVVGASDRSGNQATFSNFGPEVTISAPGEDILSTMDAGKLLPEKDIYARRDGTSMAAPHVTGTIALMLAINPNLTPAQIIQILQSSARKFSNESSCATDKVCGAGLLDAGRAVEMVKQGRF